MTKLLNVVLWSLFVPQVIIPCAGDKDWTLIDCVVQQHHDDDDDDDDDERTKNNTEDRIWMFFKYVSCDVITISQCLL